MAHGKIDRISFHFNHACPHKCGFCYMPFDRQGVGTIDLWERILDRAAEFSPDLLSFAGGDPLVYDEFYELLGRLNKRSYINLITTGFYMKKELYAKVHHNVDCICLAFDDVPSKGPSQRYSAPEFSRFEAVLDFVDSLHENITINTLVTPTNRKHLSLIADLLVAKGLQRVKWNLYKFWRFDFIELPERYELDDAMFRTSVRDLIKAHPTLDIRGWDPDERKMGYFFVTSLGRVYTVDKDDSSRYVFIGSIFDEDVYDRWLVHNTPAEVAMKYHQIVDREISKGRSLYSEALRTSRAS
jgi:MoaA/NifB/PqqE/SkfB family radical SAM enzyme